jgi:hypothetical protein
VTGGAARAYFLSSHLSGHVARLDWVAALNSVTTTPVGFGTYSVGAPVPVRANALDGAGNASVANVSYVWRLSGTDWSVNGSSDAATLDVADHGDASTATATVWVNGSFNGTPIALPAVSVYLSAVETASTGSSLSPGALDVGTAAAVTLNATGAFGYTYRATLSPGDGAAPLATTCSSVDGPGGVANVVCDFTLRYSEPGNPQPSAFVTNGYSPAEFAFPVVPVSSALSVLAGPDPDRAYLGDPVTVQVAAAARTGTAPYGPACLVSGDGRYFCDTAPGPDWTISVSYAYLGSYDATVTVADAAGTNLTVPLLVEIVDQPQITRLSLNRTVVARGGPVTASASVTGGAFPLDYWWNVSDPASTLASGEVDSDTIPPVSFVSGFIASNETVMLTVVDALGTVVANTTTLTIERPAVGVALRSPQTNGSTEAGSPLALSIVAVDASGSVVDGFAGAVTLALSSGCGPTWVNDSAGPVNGTSGTYALGAAAWSRVGLNVTVTPTEVGTCGVAATTPAFSAGTALAFPVDADAGHLHLVRPEVVRSHPGDNATLYTVLDRFGNPDPSGFLIVETRFGATLTEVDSAIRVGPGGAALVWVNYSSPGPGGTLTVLGESGVAVLGPIAIPGLPASSAVPTWAWFGLGALLAVVSVVAVVRFRRRGAAAVEETPGDPDEPLRRLAEGRAHVLARLREHDGADLDTIAAGFPGPPPDAAELAEWVGTLVTEGLVEPSVGTDGRPRFRLTNPEPAPSPPRVEVDTAALDAALAQRDRDAADEAAPPP